MIKRYGIYPQMTSRVVIASVQVKAEWRVTSFGTYDIALKTFRSSFLVPGEPPKDKTHTDFSLRRLSYRPPYRCDRLLRSPVLVQPPSKARKSL